MTFDQYWVGLGFKVGDNCHEWAKSAWNAALEEAAIVADEAFDSYVQDDPSQVVAYRIRALKASAI